MRLIFMDATTAPKLWSFTVLKTQTSMVPEAEEDAEQKCSSSQSWSVKQMNYKDSDMQR